MIEEQQEQLDAIAKRGREKQRKELEEIKKEVEEAARGKRTRNCQKQNENRPKRNIDAGRYRAAEAENEVEALEAFGGRSAAGW